MFVLRIWQKIIDSVTFKILLIMMPAVIIMAACAAPVTKSPAEAKVLRVGVIIPLSGQSSDWGLQGREGSRIYIDIINENGGLKVGGDYYKVELVEADGPIFPPSADIIAARSLIYDKGVKAIAVYYGIANAAIANITNPEKVIFNQGDLFGSYYDPIRHPYCFFGYPTLEYTGFQAIGVMKAIPGVKTLCWTGAKSGNQNLESNFDKWDKAIEQQYGIKSVRAYYNQGTLDFVPTLTKMRELNVDVVDMPGSLTEVGLMAKQGLQMGYKPYIIMTSALVDIEALRAICGSTEAMENICADNSASYNLKKTVISPYYLDMANRIRDEYVKKLHKELNPGVISVGAQMMGQYFSACQQAGSTDPDAVMKAIRGGTFETFGGKYKVSGKQNYGADVVFGYPVGISIIKNGKEQYLTENPCLDVDKPIIQVD